MKKIIVAFAILILFTSTNIAHAQDLPPLPEPATGGIVCEPGFIFQNQWIAYRLALLPT